MILSLCLLVFNLCAVNLSAVACQTVSDEWDNCCNLSSQIRHFFITFYTHDVKDRVELVIMSKCLNSDTISMTL